MFWTRVLAHDPEDADAVGKSIAKFLYRISHHIRLEETNHPLFRDLIVLRGSSAIVSRFNSTLPCVDEAMERDKVLESSRPYSYLNYAYMLNFIGLTKHALKQALHALALGVPEADVLEAGIDVNQLEKKIEDTESKIEARSPLLKIECEIIQMPNYCAQFGMGYNDLELLISEQMPEFWHDFIEADPIFSRTR